VASPHELEHGVLLAERVDPDKGAVLRRWLDESVPAAFATRVLPVDGAVARRAAGLHVPDPAPFRDVLIGANCAGQSYGCGSLEGTPLSAVGGLTNTA